MDNLDFSEDEIREQLAILGYEHIPNYRLREFKRDLDELIRCGDWKRMTTKCPPAATRPSPPAYIKEKVSLASFNDSVRGFFLHGGHTTPDRHFDSYARHSVAPKLHPLPGAPGRLPVEPDLDETIPSPLSDSYTSTPDTRGRRFMRRKVLRKVEGRSVVCDESVYSGESDTTSVLGERLEALHLSSARREAELRDGDAHSDARSNAHSDESEELSRISFESQMTGMTGGHREKPKSFIRPLIQSSRKTDPVAKYFHYKQFWEMFKPPGEADRSSVRQELKERLEYQPPPPKPRRVLVPNSYVIPTEKKRSALRWQVRNDLANGHVPYKFSCLC